MIIPMRTRVNQFTSQLLIHREKWKIPRKVIKSITIIITMIKHPALMMMIKKNKKMSTRKTTKTAKIMMLIRR